MSLIETQEGEGKTRSCENATVRGWRFLALLLCPPFTHLMWRLHVTRCDWREFSPFWKPVSFTSEQIATLMNAAQREWQCRIRLKISAGSGCTVLEIFDRDAREPSVPIQRIVL